MFKPLCSLYTRLRSWISWSPAWVTPVRDGLQLRATSSSRWWLLALVAGRMPSVMAVRAQDALAFGRRLEHSAVAAVAVGYGLAVLSSALAFAVSLLIAPQFAGAPVPVFLVAVLISAWLGRRWAGLLATALSAAGLIGSFGLSGGLSPSAPADTIFYLALFVAIAALISALLAHLRLLNERLAVAHAQAATAVTARDQFLSAAAHDLKSPLTGISLTVQMLQRRVEGGTASGQRSAGESGDGLVLGPPLRDIDRQARHMASVLDELLDLAHLDAGRALHLDRRPTRLLSLIEPVVASYQGRTEAHQVSIAGNADPTGVWDAPRITRVIDNLVANAIKYSPAGGEILVDVSIDAPAEQLGPGAETGWAVVRVCDQGLGIPPADLEHVFERFFRAGNVGSINGTGIGLAGARQIVEQHGGSLTAHSQLQHGTVFTLRLPLAA